VPNHINNKPPSATTTLPVTYDALSLARNSARLAISSGSPKRCNGNGWERLLNFFVRLIGAWPFYLIAAPVLVIGIRRYRRWKRKSKDA
jgi:hypothetical protein